MRIIKGLWEFVLAPGLVLLLEGGPEPIIELGVAEDQIERLF
jgi:hypothetical protein